MASEENETVPILSLLHQLRNNDITLKDFESWIAKHLPAAKSELELYNAIGNLNEKLNHLPNFIDTSKSLLPDDDTTPSNQTKAIDKAETDDYRKYQEAKEVYIASVKTKATDISRRLAGITLPTNREALSKLNDTSLLTLCEELERPDTALFQLNAAMDNLSRVPDRRGDLIHTYKTRVQKCIEQSLTEIENAAKKNNRTPQIYPELTGQHFFNYLFSNCKFTHSDILLLAPFQDSKATSTLEIQGKIATPFIINGFKEDSAVNQFIGNNEVLKQDAIAARLSCLLDHDLSKADQIIHILGHSYDLKKYLNTQLKKITAISNVPALPKTAKRLRDISNDITNFLAPKNKGLNNIVKLNKFTLSISTRLEETPCPGKEQASLWVQNFADYMKSR